MEDQELSNSLYGIGRFRFVEDRVTQHGKTGKAFDNGYAVELYVVVNKVSHVRFVSQFYEESGYNGPSSYCLNVMVGPLTMGSTIGQRQTISN